MSEKRGRLSLSPERMARVNFVVGQHAFNVCLIPDFGDETGGEYVIGTQEIETADGKMTQHLRLPKVVKEGGDVTIEVFDDFESLVARRDRLAEISGSVTVNSLFVEYALGMEAVV